MCKMSTNEFYAQVVERLLQIHVNFIWLISLRTFILTVLVRCLYKYQCDVELKLWIRHGPFCSSLQCEFRRLLWLACNSTRLNIFTSNLRFWSIHYDISLEICVIRFTQVFDSGLWIVNSDVMHFIRKQTFLMDLIFDPRANFRFFIVIN